LSRSVVFAIPGELESKTGGYAYDRRMMAELSALGWDVRHLALPGSYPFPSVKDAAAAAAALGDLDPGQGLIIDGLAYGAMAGLADRCASRLRITALVHHPLALEGGLATEAAQALARDEARALAAAHTVATTSKTTARTLVSDYDVYGDRVFVAPPGTDPGPTARACGDPPVLVSVGALVPRKGHDLLVDALATLSDLPWFCRIVGDPFRDHAWATALSERVLRAGLGDRITFTGEVPDARVEIAAADLFVLASRHEGYGMAYAEAISQGLPILGCAVGHVPELVPEEAGVLVAPDDAPALARALRALIEQPWRRRDLAAGARRAAGSLPTWSGSASVLERALLAARP
jgi:glycosyltransferase involved in cell wall biosynthesis